VDRPPLNHATRLPSYSHTLPTACGVVVEASSAEFFRVLAYGGALVQTLQLWLGGGFSEMRLPLKQFGDVVGVATAWRPP
jgi:hypothetical protein